MPYIGARTRLNQKTITVKIHGPNPEDFKTSNEQLSSYVRAIAASLEDANMYPMAERIGEQLAEVLSDDHNALWAEIEITNLENGEVFGTFYMINKEAVWT